MTSTPQLIAPPAPRSDMKSAGFWARLRRPVVCAVVGFLATRIYFYIFFSAAISDIGVYFQYVVQGVDYGRMPYLQTGEPPLLLQHDIRKLEYPPVAYWVMALPRQLSTWRVPPEPTDKSLWEAYDNLTGLHLRHYDLQFRAWMLLFDLTGFALFAAILRRRRPELLTWGLWGYTLATTCLGYVLLERLDVVLTVSLLGWVYCRLRADDHFPTAWLWTTAGYALLGLGISFKLIPVLAVPFALWSDVPALWNKPRDWKRLIGPAMLAVTAVAPFAYYYTLVGPDLWGMFRFHSNRGVQIESSYATAMMLGAPRESLLCYYDYGSWNLGGPWEAGMLKIANLLLPGGLLLLGLRALAAPLLREKYDGVVAFRAVCVVVPLATLLAKVFSVQYLLWAVPLLLLGAAEYFRPRAFQAVVILAVLACALTGFLFPYHYLEGMHAKPYSKLNPAPYTLIENQRLGEYDGKKRAVGDLSTGLPRTAMIARNLIFGALCIGLTVVSLQARRNARPS